MNTANFRIVAWCGSTAFLICLGRTPGHCERRLLEASEDLLYGVDDWNGASLQEWIPSPTRQYRGRWYTILSMWDKFSAALQTNECREFYLQESA